MKRSEVTIPCGTLSLEGVLEMPEGRGAAVPAAVVCHPHPLYGGNMHNNVVKALRRGFLDQGFACLRFNFRGTGQSWGTHGNGLDEVDDVLAAVDFISLREEVGTGPVVLAGYSFGCWVGLKAAARDTRVSALVGISPPLDMYDFSFLTEETRPKLLVSGDRDFVCSTERFEELTRHVPEPKRVVLLPNTDHFHMGGEDILVRELRSFLEAYC
jgi:uncharacterized protein